MITLLLQVKLKSRPREPKGCKTEKEGALCLRQIEKPKTGHPFPYVLYVGCDFRPGVRRWTVAAVTDVLSGF